MNIADHFKYYHGLPEDLQNLIISMIRHPISKDLETDIVNETEKEIIRNVLYKEDLLNIFDIDDCCEETMNHIILDI